MPGVANASHYVPQIVGGPSTLGPSVNTTRIRTSASDTHVGSIWSGCWLIASTNSHIACSGTGGGSPSPDASASYVVAQIFDSNGVRVPGQYVHEDELNTSGAIYILEVYPIGGLVFDILEDGDTTPITEANSGSGAARYAEFTVTEPDALTPTPTTLLARNPFARVQGRILLDSTSVTGTVGTVTLQLLGASPTADNAEYSASGARMFRAKFVAAQASETQT